MRENKIKIKVIILIFITLIPLSILKVLDIRNHLKFSIDAELNASQDFAESINVSFMNFLEKTWTSQYMIGKAIIANTSWNKNDIEIYLATVLPQDEAIIGYSWISNEGKVIASTNPQVRGMDFDERDYFKKIVAGEEQVVSNLVIASNGKDVIVPIARGIRVNNQLKGIMVSILDVNDIQNIFPIKRLGEGSTFGLIDNNAMMVYRNSNNNLPFDKREVKQDSPSRIALKGEIVRTYAKYSGFDGTERMGIDYPIKDIGWSCFVTTSVEALLKNEINAFKKDIIMFILIFIISFMVATFFSRKHVNSINTLKYATYEVLNGNLDYRIQTNESDDLADVLKLFNNMVLNLKQQKQELEEYNNLKTQFLSTMSHELKTPLNIILGCVQVIEKMDFENTNIGNRLSKYVKMQKQNSFRLLRLINNLIDINKSEVNQMQLSLTNGDIVNLIENVTLSIVEYTKLKEIEVVFDTEFEEKIITFDSDMIERIMLNLLSNAIKFTEPGGSVLVNIYDKVDKIQISVKDTGIGIPKDKLDFIFDRFTQVDNSLRRKSEGSGIGLSLVKYLAELHEGSISVKSEVGEGSEFILELPVRVVDFQQVERISKDSANVERISIEFSDIYM